MRADAGATSRPPFLASRGACANTAWRSQASVDNYGRWRQGAEHTMLLQHQTPYPNAGRDGIGEMNAKVACRGDSARLGYDWR